MATFVKFDCFTEHLAEKVHNLQSDNLTIALTNTAPTSTLTQVSGITEIAYTWTATSRLVVATSSAQTAGTYKLVIPDLTITATSTSPSFRYVVLYNASATTPANALIGYWDYGSSISLNAGESLTIDSDQVNGVLTIA